MREALTLLSLTAALTGEPVIDVGAYDTCVTSGAPGLAGPVPTSFGITIHEVQNYTFMRQPGRFELRDGLIHWLQGPLKGQPPGEYVVDATQLPNRTMIRFQPNLPQANSGAGLTISCTRPTGSPAGPDR